MRIRYILLIVLLLTLGFGAGRLSAATGTLDSPGPPGSTYSYTLENIYNRLNDGTMGAQSAFAEPASGPLAGTGHTLNEIMALAPAVDDTYGATQTHVLAGRTAWGLNSDQWGPFSGAMPDNGAAIITPQTTNQTIAAGYHDGSGYVLGDIDLVAGNIRAEANIFGIAGNSNVVNTSSGDATTDEILSGKRAWVDGTEIIGSGVFTSDYFAFVPKTGQTACWNSSGNPVSCTGTGQDGEYQLGIAWPNPRFTDNGNGTITDNMTGLIWLENANCFGQRNWTQALTDANTLNNGECGLTDGSLEGDWRLPNVKELHSLVHFGFHDPAVPNTVGTGQWSEGDPFSGVQSDSYWSSTTNTSYLRNARHVFMNSGGVQNDDKLTARYVWPVSGGQ